MALNESISGWQAQQRDLVLPAVTQSRSIDRVEIASNALAKLPDLLSGLADGRGLLVVSDENTKRAAGDAAIARLVEAGFDVEDLVFPARPRPKPTTELAQRIVDALAANDRVPLAIGSGVINDLVKYAARQTARDYACVATAASMDGYTSAGAPLSDKGFKQTIQCAPPRIIVADLDVITAAPKEMTGWGYADLAGKLPAGADWILADILGVEPIDANVWPMVQDHLRDWLSEPGLIANGDSDATAGLFAGLLMSGMAMEVYGSSRPASGADHQIAHLWEMEGLSFAGETVSHGACVSLGTLTVLSLYEYLLAQDVGEIDIKAQVARWPTFDHVTQEIRSMFPDERIAQRTIEEAAGKYIDGAALELRLEKLRSAWPELRPRLGSFLMPMAQLRSMLTVAGVVTHPSQIGMTSEHHRQTVLASRHLRSRYTILDLLAETGWLDPALDALFSPSGPWSKPERGAATG
ncbi:MAG: sn-glycerol-1-phosphate dehydrogenase [Pseudomonadota bacterium]